MDTEGVIKFALTFDYRPLDDIDLAELQVWRRILFALDLLGQNAHRYGGLSFGNVSMRTPSGFVISGSQTGHLDLPGAEAFAEVIAWHTADNRVVARGLTRPSSESLTHAALYDLSADIHFVFHVHSPEIWRNIRARRGKNVDVPETGERVAYGTPAMAAEVRRVCAGRSLPAAFVMGGHEDGVVAYGADADGPGLLLVRLLAQSLRNF